MAFLVCRWWEESAVQLDFTAQILSEAQFDFAFKVPHFHPFPFASAQAQ